MSPAHQDLRPDLPGAGPTPLRLYGDLHRASAGVALHFHAGAFTAGTLDDGAPAARALQAAGLVVVSVDYPLAPEHPFPAAAEAGHAALHWVARRLRTPVPLLVAGEEAGANLAAATALMARDRGGPALSAQILVAPMLDACLGTASQRAAGQGRADCRGARGWRAYLGRPGDAQHPYACPSAALRLAGLPRSLIVTAGDDPMRDEALAFAARLVASGVEAVFAELDMPTGWPASCCAEPPCSAWATALSAQVARFLGQPAHARPPVPTAT